MANWVIVAALGSILATVWLGWLLYRINQPPAQRNRDPGDAGVAGGTSPSKDVGSDGGGDGGGD